MDSFDGFPPEKKAKYILEIAKPIINKDPGYEQTSKAFSDYAEEALRETFAFYAQLFPKLEADILLVINPFFMNGGMGDVQTLPEGQRAGRLEIGTSVISNNPVTGRHGVQVWIAHEMTHVVHLLLGAKDALDDLDSPEAMKGLSKYYFGLYTEGLATYTSSLIAKLNHDENLELLYFSDAYSSGPIYEKGFVPSLAKKFLDTVEDKDPVDKEFHGQWFGSKTPPEERPVPQYPFLGYFLGAHGIKTLIDEGTPLEDLFKQSLYDMLKDMKRAVNILAKV
ncbi:MAG: hypothetical protein B6D68_03510 [spirochete symbiont of Stewartia floridana]|nr:MAG: hypothetical protein B6D68_03510 [spirochete symbiont of Stewartia floridana]